MVKRGLSRADFVRIQHKKLLRAHGTLFSLSIAPLLSHEKSRFACVVSKKTASKAVVRNRIKRICREILQNNIHNRTKGTALVLYAKQAAGTATNKDLRQDVEALLRATYKRT